MKTLLILCFTLISLEVFTTKVEGQNCIEPVMDDVVFAANSAIDKISLRRLGINDVNITIFNFTISCLSVGRMRDRFRFATVVTYVSTPSDALVLDGCPANTVCLSFFELSCNDASNIWEDNDVFAIESFTIDGNATIFLNNNISRRMNCGSCGYEGSVSPLANPQFDPLTHCFSCNPVCRDEGLSFCFGLTSVSCCSYYRNDMCSGECDIMSNMLVLPDFSCVCNNSFLEPDCLICPLNECANNGTLISEDCYCECRPGFNGPRCENNINECITRNVNCNNGECIDQVNGFTCSCYLDYTGEFCDTVIDQCEGSNPCLNNGTCMDGNSTFTCSCAPGYTGSTCDQPFNICDTNPCLNGGQCRRDLFDNFTCICPINFSGRICEICDIENCQVCSATPGLCSECSTPYYNLNGQCQFICDALSPCENGGTCSNDTSGCYTCSCPPNYTGINCTVDICDVTNCQNNGTCTSGGVCNCLPGFTGTSCETCLVEYCDICSADSGIAVCVSCRSGYKLQNGVCVPVSGCSIAPDPDLCIWKQIVDRCNFPLATCTDKDHTSYSEYRNRLKCYEKHKKEWKKKSDIPGLKGEEETEEVQELRHNDDKKRDMLIKKWRKELSEALINLQKWREYFMDKVPNANVPPLPSRLETNIDGLDPFSLHDEYIRYYRNLLTVFENQAVPQYCTQ